MGDKSALQKKNDGGANNRYYEASETLSQLDEVKAWLQKTHKKVDDSVVDMYVGNKRTCR